MTTIKEVTGNILTLKRGIIVHGCNSKGKMNSGIAKSIRARYPGVFQVYDKEYQEKGLRLGGVTYYQPSAAPGVGPLVIANAITQERYGRDENVVYVDYPAVSICFKEIARKARELQLPVHFPLIGCGLANGTWEDVAVRIEAALGPDIEKTLWLFPDSASKPTGPSRRPSGAPVQLGIFG